MSQSIPLEALTSPAHIASVSLRVRNLEAVAAFYRDVLGLVAVGNAERVTLAAGDGTVLVELVAAPLMAAPLPTMPGLFHTAFLLPERTDLANWVMHAEALGVGFEGASDHLVSEAIYLSDPEGNGVEVYVDRERAIWPRDGAMIRMATLPLDRASLLAERDKAAGPWHYPAGGRIGHVHLKVGDLTEAETFYRERLGLTVMASYPSATFMGWGGYHHHVAINVWQSRGAVPRPTGVTGLNAVNILATATTPWSEAGELSDPAGNHLILT